MLPAALFVILNLMAVYASGVNPSLCFCPAILPICKDGSKPIVHPGECCPRCPVPIEPPTIDCRLVLCAAPDCHDPIPPKPGQCCPTCLDPAPSLVCPPLPEDSRGICVELCSAYDDCPKGQLCCSNGCGHVCTVGVPPPSRVYEFKGKIYRVGQSFPAGDRCNTCTCTANNNVACTEIACLPPPPTCPPDKPPVNCFVDPCQFAKCPAHPNAKCVSDFCGGCNARFFEDGEEVTDTCNCPVKGQVFTRCGSACPPNCTTPNPICTKQCVPHCECPRGTVINELTNKCVPIKECPKVITPHSTEPTPPPKLALVCPPLRPGAIGICINLCSGDRDCSKDRKCCSNGCGRMCKKAVPAGVVCKFNGKIYNVGESFPAGDGCNTCTCLKSSRVVCTLIACSPPPTCPPDKPPVNCFVDPCQFVKCPVHPFAKCVSDFCGGCNARFFEDGGEVTDTCNCPVKGQVFTRYGSACPPNCTTPNPICTKQCVPRCECPRGTVINELTNKCVRKDKCPLPGAGNCPPKCSAAYCGRNPSSICSVPGPREIPGCTGSCQVTYCSACYFSNKPRPLPGSCGTCGAPVSTRHCLKKWAYCVGRASWRKYGRPSKGHMMEENFRCYRYPCPLQG